MAKEKAEVASLNPDDFMSAGLKSDFRARITEALYCHWDYRGSLPEPVLGVRLTMAMLDEDGEPVEDEKGEPAEYIDTWSAGSLDAFVPSEDGKTAADDDTDPTGEYALKVGKRPQMNNNTGFAHLMQTIIAAGEASKHFTREDLTASLSCLVGLDAQWGRVPKKKRPGLDEQNDKKKEGKSNDDILVVTEVFGYGDGKKKKAGAKTTAKDKPAKGKPAKEDDDDDAGDDVDPIDAKLHEIIKEELGDDGTIKRAKLANLVIKAAAKDKDKAKMVKRVGEDDFLENGPWTYDDDEGTLTAE